MADEDPLTGYELDAWQVPPPPVGLADRVIAQLSEAPPAAALDVPRRKSRARRWVAGAGLALVASATALLVLGTMKPAREGAITATRLAHLALGASSAELEAGAEIRWRRTGDVVTIEQRRGVATWRAGGTDQLVIDAGAMVAAVEATGASLRVEVTMNQADAKVLGASAVTAAAVAVVTIAVYNGHVTVRGQGQTVNVTSGEMVEVQPGKPVQVVAAVFTGGCDLAELRRSADAAMAEGRDHESLDLTEVIARCRTPDMLTITCRAKQVRAARAMYAKLTPAQQRVQLDVCLALGTDPRPEATAAATPCDAKALGDEGRIAFEVGLFARAAWLFDASLRCKLDPATVPRAVLAACLAKDVELARTWWPKLASRQRSRILQRCADMKIDPR